MTVYWYTLCITAKVASVSARLYLKTVIANNCVILILQLRSTYRECFLFILANKILLVINTWLNICAAYNQSAVSYLYINKLFSIILLKLSKYGHHIIICPLKCIENRAWPSWVLDDIFSSGYLRPYTCLQQSIYPINTQNTYQVKFVKSGEVLNKFRLHIFKSNTVCNVVYICIWWFYIQNQFV